MRVEIKKLSEAEKRQYVPFAWGLSVQGNEVILKFVGPENLMEFYIEPEVATEIADGLVKMARLFRRQSPEHKIGPPLAIEAARPPQRSPYVSFPHLPATQQPPHIENTL
jgi:hypothetical protein